MIGSELKERLRSLYAEWLRVLPLPQDIESKLWSKLRIEWNYNSNHIEGNTLTYGETELLMIHDQVAGNHPLRDYEEMKAHNLAITYVHKLAEEGRDLSEGDIRDLNKILLKEPFWKEAITPEGDATRKQIIPGEYKTAPNNVRTASGLVFEFAPPLDVPERMRNLIAWLRESLKSENYDLIELVTKLHHDFALIHPFDDGNGRCARLLINYILFRYKYPPIVVKAADKSRYLEALRAADAADLVPLETFLARNLVWSLELGLRAARGENIEDVSDIEKEIALFVRENAARKTKVRARNPEDIRHLVDVSWKPLYDKFLERTKTLGNLFAASKWRLTLNNRIINDGIDNLFEHVKIEVDKVTVFQATLSLTGYIGEASQPFNISASIQTVVGDHDYRIIPTASQPITRLYSEPLLSDESDEIIQAMLKFLFQQVKQYAGKT